MLVVSSLNYIGNKLDSNQYNAETVAERDFLRTEGDPAAVGYAIKEAVALIRSMVSTTYLCKHNNIFFVSCHIVLK